MIGNNIRKKFYGAQSKGAWTSKNLNKKNKKNFPTKLLYNVVFIASIIQLRQV